MKHIGDPRTALLVALAAVVEMHQADSETCGREALRLMRQAEATWADLLSPTEPSTGEPNGKPWLLAQHGYQTIEDARTGGRNVLALAHLATPAELARAAVLANRPPPNSAERSTLTDLTHSLLNRVPA